MKIVTFLDNVAFHCITKISNNDVHYMRAAGAALGLELTAGHCFNDLYNGKVLRKEHGEVFICISKGTYYSDIPLIEQLLSLFKAERTYWQIVNLRGSPQNIWASEYMLNTPLCPMFDACE